MTDGGDCNNYDHADWAQAMDCPCSYHKPELIDPNRPYIPEDLYPPQDKLIASPGNSTYFVDPVKGDDAKAGMTQEQAWQSIAKINALQLAAGDKVVFAPGVHTESLKPSGEGTAQKPIVIQFLPGVHEFGVDDAIRLPLFVSNSCDAPTQPKPIGIIMQNVKHLRVQGGGVVDASGTETEVLSSGGRHSQITGDHAPGRLPLPVWCSTSSERCREFSVIGQVCLDNVIIQVAEGSDYAIEKGKFVWKGDIGTGPMMVQQAIPDSGGCVRMGFSWNPLNAAEHAEDLGGHKVRLTWKNSNYGLRVGQQYHFRSINRDSVGVHNTRCKDIVINDCDFYALTNMGFVSQFSENITYQRVNVAPPAGTIRTCPAWGDVFQFSNCKGDILVDSCRISGMQDDAINCHGTHLRIIEKTGDNQFLMRFMQPQTYGFAAYMPGDEVAVIKHATLREYDSNPRRKVVKVERKTDKDWLLTLDGPVPTFGPDDVLDNITWYPNLTATNNHISVDPVRGFLVTTRGKVLIEGNTFQRCAMAAILSEDDAEGWFESGPVRDMAIRNNKFINCGIEINPHTSSSKPEEWVHENIHIEGNFFNGAGISAHNVKGLTVIGNRSPGGSVPVNVAPSCTEVKVENNNIKGKQ